MVEECKKRWRVCLLCTPFSNSETVCTDRMHVCVCLLCQAAMLFPKDTVFQKLHGSDSCRHCKDFFFFFFARSRPGQCLTKAQMGGPCHKSLHLCRAKSSLSPPIQCDWHICSFPDQEGIFCKYTESLSSPPLPHILEKNKQTDPLHLPLPHLKGLQFLELLSVICVVLILASLEMSCQTTGFGISVVLFSHRVTLFFISHVHFFLNGVIGD